MQMAGTSKETTPRRVVGLTFNDETQHLPEEGAPNEMTPDL